MNVQILKEQLMRFFRIAAMPKEELQKLQEQKLRVLLRHAFQNSVYYRNAFTEAGITEENIDTAPIQAFPTLDKTKLMEHYEEVLTVNGFGQDELRAYDESHQKELFLGKYHVVHSSGSTGIPRYFVYSEEEWAQIIIGELRAALWGMKPEEIFRLLASNVNILYIAITNGRYGGVMAATDGIKAANANQMLIDINEPLESWIERVQQFKPDIIVG